MAEREHIEPGNDSGAGGNVRELGRVVETGVERVRRLQRETQHAAKRDDRDIRTAAPYYALPEWDEAVSVRHIATLAAAPS